MPSLISEESDSYNIDYYYLKYRDHHGIEMAEAKPESFRVLPADISLVTCDASSTKKHHYFKVPTQPQLATCLCGKYHTNFTSQYYKISPQTILGTAPMETSPIISAKRFNRITNKLQTSPITKQQQQLTANSKILFPNFNTNPTPSEITYYSQHHHTCLCCKQNLFYVSNSLIPNIHLTIHNALFSKTSYYIVTVFLNSGILNSYLNPKLLLLH